MGWQITFGGTRRTQDEYAAAVKADRFASRWEGGTVVDFDDLTPDFFGQIAKDDLTATWYGVYLSPMSDNKRLYRVVSACATHAGVEVPPAPATMRDAVDMLLMFEETEDPTGESSESTTGSSTGPSSDSDGSPLPQDES